MFGKQNKKNKKEKLNRFTEWDVLRQIRVDIETLKIEGNTLHHTHTSRKYHTHGVYYVPHSM